MMRQSWIDKGDTVALTWQCTLAGVSRATAYALQKPKLIALDDGMLKRLIDEEYTRHPFYSSRKMVVYLGRCCHTVNRQAGTAPDAHAGPARHATRPQLYNGERPHQALKNQTPDVVHQSAAGGGAMILQNMAP